MTADGAIVGDYQLGKKLGQGGYGVVHAARDLKLDRDIALKLLRTDHVTRPLVVRRFLQEARSAAKVVHPGIVTVYECGESAGTVYIAMELLTGEVLSARLKRERIPLERALDVALQISAALEAAHEKGIVHRDLKPDNIFLVPDAVLDSGERAKVLDFGIAKLADADEVTNVHTSSMAMMGTPKYMSPEQCRSTAAVDHRTDIYSLGCILFELLVGRTPFAGDNGEQIAKHQLEAVPRPRTFVPDLPREIDQLVVQMLAKDPDDRPLTMAIVQARLHAIVDGTSGSQDAVVAPAPPPKRRSRALEIGVVAIAMLSGIAATTVVMSQRSNDPPEIRAVDDRVASRAGGLGPRAPAEPAQPEISGDAQRATCKELIAARSWDELVACADTLAKVDAFTAKDFRATAIIEARNLALFGKVSDAIVRNQPAEAFDWLAKIDDDSVYRPEAQKAWEASLPPAETPIACNATKFADAARANITGGHYAQALIEVERALACQADASLYRLAALAACNSKNQAKAHAYFVRIPASQQTALGQICIRNGIKVP